MAHPSYPTPLLLESRGVEHEVGVPVGDTTSVRSVEGPIGLHSCTSSSSTFSMHSLHGFIYSCLPSYAKSRSSISSRNTLD